MTQPPLSRQIRLLEERLDLVLLERSNRHVRLTSAGESFYRSALDLLQRSERAVLEARQAERGETGAIALGFVPSAAFHFVPLIAARMAEDLPNVKLTPIEMMGYEVIDAQRSGRIDLGLTRMERPRAEIDRRRVVHEPFVLALPRNHRFATAPHVTLADLNGEPYISFTKDRGGYLKETIDALFYDAGITPDTRLEASQTHAVISLVNHGLGFALVPRSAQVLQMAGTVYREIDLPAQFRSDMYLVTRPELGTAQDEGQEAVLQTKVKMIICEVLAPFYHPVGPAT